MPWYFVDSRRAGVVGGQSQGDVVVIADQELVEIGRAPANILVWLETVVDTLFGGRFGHELHEAAGAGAADRMAVAVAFGFYDAGKQVGVEVVLLPGFGEHFMQVSWG